MSQYYNSKPRHYRRTMGKQMIQDFYATGWFTLVALIALSVGTYEIIINYSDDAARFMNDAWVALFS
jgi:hypothetical protein